MRIFRTEFAKDKLEFYADFIAQDNPVATWKWIETIQKNVERLIYFPQSGPYCP